MTSVTEVNSDVVGFIPGVEVTQVTAVDGQTYQPKKISKILGAIASWNSSSMTVMLTATHSNTLVTFHCAGANSSGGTATIMIVGTL